MSDASSGDTQLRVEQSDREIAALLVEESFGKYSDYADEIRLGLHDSDASVQDAARRRVSEVKTAERDALVRRLEDAKWTYAGAKQDRASIDPDDIDAVIAIITSGNNPTSVESATPVGDLDMSKYDDMDLDERAIAMADDCVGDPWELLGYFREKLRQAEEAGNDAKEYALKSGAAARISKQEAAELYREIEHIRILVIEGSEPRGRNELLQRAIEKANEIAARSNDSSRRNDLERDAARWRALMSSDRIRMMGAAGFDTDENGTVTLRDWEGWHHMGLEVWDRHPAKGDESDIHGRKILLAYVDAIVAQTAK